MKIIVSFAYLMLQSTVKKKRILALWKSTYMYVVLRNIAQISF